MKKETKKAAAETKVTDAQCAPLQEGNSKEADAPRFTKAQLLTSSWYSHRRDALNALLADDGEYTHEQVRECIEKFMKGEVE
jgi:hypothetical protein